MPDSEYAWLAAAHERRLEEDEKDVFIQKEVVMKDFIAKVVSWFKSLFTRRAAPAAPPVPVVKPTQKEAGEYLGRGNPPPPDPNARPLWEFDFAPDHYGATITAVMGGAAPVTITPNADGRWDGPGGIVFKKGNKGKARLHDKFGSQATICTIEFTPK